MTCLIACLSTGKGSWSQVIEIIKSVEWEKIILVTNDFGKEKFKVDIPVEFITIDFNQSPDIMRDQIIASLHGKNLGLEVALNITSGAGNEHMALISAILKLGLGLRMFFLKNGKLEELKLFDYSFDAN